MAQSRIIERLLSSTSTSSRRMWIVVSTPRGCSSGLLTNQDTLFLRVEIQGTSARTAAESTTRACRFTLIAQGARCRFPSFSSAGTSLSGEAWVPQNGGTTWSLRWRARLETANRFHHEADLFASLFEGRMETIAVCVLTLAIAVSISVAGNVSQELRGCGLPDHYL